MSRYRLTNSLLLALALVAVTAGLLLFMTYSMGDGADEHDGPLLTVSILALITSLNFAILLWRRIKGRANERAGTVGCGVPSPNVPVGREKPTVPPPVRFPKYSQP